MRDAATQASAYVAQKIRWLADERNAAASKAALANLRRGIGKLPGSMPELWGSTMAGLPDVLVGRSESPTVGERSVYVALTLFALHQQGKDPAKECMSREGASLGSAVRQLIKADEDEERIKRRFDAAATSDNLEEFSHHLRGLVQLFKAEKVPLDYPALSKNLYWFAFPDTRDSVRLQWGRDFYRFSKTEDTSETTK